MKFKEGDLFYHKFRKIIGEASRISPHGSGCVYCMFGNKCKKYNADNHKSYIVNGFKACASRQLTDREKFLYYTHGKEAAIKVAEEEERR